MDQDKIKNMFTRYVITAVDRTRRSYIDRTAERYAKEYPVEWESGENPYLYDHKIWDQMEQEAAPDPGKPSRLAGLDPPPAAQPSMDWQHREAARSQ